MYNANIWWTWECFEGVLVCNRIHTLQPVLNHVAQCTQHGPLLPHAISWSLCRVLMIQRTASLLSWLGVAVAANMSWVTFHVKLVPVILW